MASSLVPITGTASVTNGSTAVAVSGMVLSALNCAQGAQVFLGGAGYFVASDGPTDTTHFTLERAYEGSTGTVTCSIGQVTPEMTSRIALARTIAGYDASAQLIAANQAGLSYQYSGSTAAPASGQVALNNTTPASATAINFAEADLSGQNIADRLGRIGSGDELTIRAVDGSARVTYVATAAASDKGSYEQVTVTYLGASGVLAAGAQVVIERIAYSTLSFLPLDGSKAMTGQLAIAADGVPPPAKDLNAVTSTGFTYADSTVANKPTSTGAGSDITVLTQRRTSTVFTQIGVSWVDGSVYTRVGNGGSWSAWMPLALVSRGNWTPSLTFGGLSTGIAYAAQSGSYVCVDDVVLLSGSIQLSSKGTATGSAQINGFPFPAGDVGSTLIDASGMASMSGALSGILLTGGTGLLLRQNGSGSATATDAAFGNSTFLRFSFAYHL